MGAAVEQQQCLPRRTSLNICVSREMRKILRWFPLCVYLQECWTFLSSSHSGPLAGLDDRAVSERLTEVLSDTLQVRLLHKSEGPLSVTV